MLCHLLACFLRSSLWNDSCSFVQVLNKPQGTLQDHQVFSSARWGAIGAQPLVGTRANILSFLSPPKTGAFRRLEVTVPREGLRDESRSQLHYFGWFACGRKYFHQWHRREIILSRQSRSSNGFWRAHTLDQLSWASFAHGTMSIIKQHALTTPPKKLSKTYQKTSSFPWGLLPVP